MLGYPHMLVGLSGESIDRKRQGRQASLSSAETEEGGGEETPPSSPNQSSRRRKERSNVPSPGSSERPPRNPDTEQAPEKQEP